jgi:hypothetical protein
MCAFPFSKGSCLSNNEFAILSRCLPKPCKRLMKEQRTLIEGEGLSTVDLLINIGCLVKEKKYSQPI